nr:hypothetical protein [Tanacetum cinerariifolium]
MDQDSAHMVAASKVPMLKPGEFKIWRMRIEQYIKMTDYALWKVIKNAVTLPKHKLWKLKFNSIKNAKQLLEAVEKRFGGNAATKKTQRNLLKKQHKNFTASSSEMLDQTFGRLQKLVYEPEVKGMSSSSSSTQNMAFVSSSNNNSSSINGEVNTAQAVNTANGVFTASTQVNAAYSTNINNLSDVVIFSFFATQPNSPQLVYEDLEQIHPDDMEEIDLRWQMTILVSCHGLDGYVWSDQAEEWPNYALMAFSSSSSDSKLVFYSFDEFVNNPVAKKCEAKSSDEEPKVDRKNDDALIIEEWVSDNEEENVSQPKT